jgi:hypothetical protein
LTEMEQLEYEDIITNFMFTVNEITARGIALDLWKHYPRQTLWLAAALAQTQHTKVQPKLFQAKE